MLRELRTADVPKFNTLITREFPRETELLGIHAGAQERIVRRALGPAGRLLFGFARAVGHPIARFFVVEADHVVVATAVLSYTPRAGYIGAVSVDPAYRRRGFGRIVLDACAQGARAAGKPFTALDVIHDNTPAQELYRALGYRLLRVGAFYRKDVERGRAALPVPAGVRPVRRSDRKALVAIAAAALPAEVARVLPIQPSSFTLPPLLVRFLESESEGWVIDDGTGAFAFVRGTVGRALESGNLTSPILAPNVPIDRAREFVRFAASWVASRGAPRIIVEQWDDRSSCVEVLKAEGWTPAIPIDTLYLPLDG